MQNSLKEQRIHTGVGLLVIASHLSHYKTPEMPDLIIWPSLYRTGVCATGAEPIFASSLLPLDSHNNQIFKTAANFTNFALSFSNFTAKICLSLPVKEVLVMLKLAQV